MQPTPDNLGGPKFPPNPKVWPHERNGHGLRRDFQRPVHACLDPFEIARTSEGVELLGRSKFEGIVGHVCAAELFGRSKDVWSGFVVPVDGLHLIVVNSTHAITRQHATLTEELFHIRLRHKPCRIYPCPISGLLRREYSSQIEDEAYWSAAAALVPYASLKGMFKTGSTVESIAEHFGVSTKLVHFRLNITRLRRRAAASK